MKFNGRTWLVGCVWIAAGAIGSIALAKYSNHPGLPAKAPVDWPAAAAIPQGIGRPTIVIFLHPHCPCSRVTLREFKRLWEPDHPPAQVDILFYQPGSEPSEWAKTDLWKQAAAIPGTRVSAVGLDDLKRFGALTSGQLMLFDAKGGLVYSGGMTGARGFEGDNAGQEAIDAFLHGRSLAIKSFPVFGCALYAAEPEFAVRQ